ncbi:MAG: haloacid dehalogenase-like hydrolase, partial [Verrucomicrobiota bacterium]|nr:haloacid dehalogenase-like hydrolase [Verrucomicrobiota bacterium]
MTKKNLHRQNIVACIWDFDKTLIPGYMQAPIFEAFGIDEEQFWKEVNALPDIYAKRGTRVSCDTIYLNHLISFVK